MSSLPIHDRGSDFEKDLLYPPGDERRKKIDAIDFRRIQQMRPIEALRDLMTRPHVGSYSNAEEYDPPGAWINEVHFRICEALHVQNGSDLRVKPALKTSADIYAGTDFVFLYTDPQTKKQVIVTVDLSLQNKPTFKADVLITPHGAKAQPGFTVSPIQHDSLGGKADQQEFRRKIAEFIAEVIKEKLSEDTGLKYGSIADIMGQARARMDGTMVPKRLVQREPQRKNLRPKQVQRY